MIQCKEVFSPAAGWVGPGPQSGSPDDNQTPPLPSDSCSNDVPIGPFFRNEVPPILYSDVHCNEVPLGPFSDRGETIPIDPLRNEAPPLPMRCETIDIEFHEIGIRFDLPTTEKSNEVPPTPTNEPGTHLASEGMPPIVYASDERGPGPIILVCQDMPPEPYKSDVMSPTYN